MSQRSTADPVRPRRPRLFYLDLVRALATLIIVLTHFNNPYLAGGGSLLTNQPFGIYVGGLGVSLFLIISGSALTYTYGGASGLDLKRFYWKRFKGIYPMFWIAWFCAVVYYFSVNQGFPPIKAPLRNLIFTVLGMDGYLANFHIPTAYILGEWFLGFIVMFYIIFPVLLWAVENFPVPTAAVLLLIYGAALLGVPPDPGFPTSILLPIRLPELAFGMYFVSYVRRVPPAVVVPAAVVLAVSALLPVQIPEDLATTAVGISSFLILVVLGRVVAIGPVRVLVSLIAKYSYPIFLVHHVVIMEMYAKINTTGFPPVQRWVMLASVCLITFALAVALERVTATVTAYFGRSFKGEWWKPQAVDAGR